MNRETIVLLKPIAMVIAGGIVSALCVWRGYPGYALATLGIAAMAAF